MLHNVPITKAGKTAHITVDDATLSDDILANIIREGLKVCLNSKMTKITGMKELEGEALAKLQADAMEIARKNLAALTDGSFKFSGSRAKSTDSREVINEAMRLAREFIKDELRAQSITISHVPAKDITAAAKQLVEAEDIHGFKAKARESLAKRKETPAAHIDLAKLGIKPDEAKVEAAAKAKAERNERAKTLSAKQAGKTAGRATKSKPTATAGEVLAGLSTKGNPSTHVH